jgi:hypothetical protein
VAINSQGSQILHADVSASPDPSPLVYVELEEVTQINGPDGSLNLIDTSHLGSTRKEYLPGLADNGTIQLACNFTAGTKQMEMFDLFNGSADPQPFRIKIPTDSTRTEFHTFDFDAIVTRWSLADAVDSKVGLNITLQTTGGVEYVGIV